MEKVLTRHILFRIAVPLLLAGVALVMPARVLAQYYTPELTPPPPAAMPTPPPIAPGDSVPLHLPIPPTVPMSYEDLMRDELAYDLATPSNITTEAEYDPLTGCYVVHTRMGGVDIATPFMLTAQQYNNWQFRRSMQQYYRERKIGRASCRERV